jgi:signal peptidase II
VTGTASARRVRALLAFLGIAIAIVVGDQLLKAWVVGNYAFDKPSPIVGDWLRIDLIHNSGGLFGMVQGSAPILGAVSLAVVVALIAIEWRMAWRSPLLTLTMALLLGGAVGNFIDRARFGYVVDFADIGIGTWRFYIFNLADSAVTISICLVLGVALLGPWLDKRFGWNLTGEGASTATGEVAADPPADETEPGER